MGMGVGARKLAGHTHARQHPPHTNRAHSHGATQQDPLTSPRCASLSKLTGPLLHIASHRTRPPATAFRVGVSSPTGDAGHPTLPNVFRFGHF